MNQSNYSNESLAQLLNHKSNSSTVHKLYTRALDLYLYKGLITEKERASLSMKASLSDEFLYKQFSVARQELADIFDYPLGMFSNEDVYNMLVSGEYSWDEILMMNDDARRDMLIEISLEEEG